MILVLLFSVGVVATGPFCIMVCFYTGCQNVDCDSLAENLGPDFFIYCDG